MKSRTLATAIAVFVLLCVSLSVSALDLPSNISGVYQGSDRVCSLVLSESTALTKDAELSCITWAPTDQIYNLQRLGQPDGFCPSDSQVFQFRSAFFPLLTPGTPGFRIVGFDANSLTVRVGIPAELGLGGGVTQVWTRIATLPSPAPYTCGVPAPNPSPHYARHCRNLGFYCGG